MSKAKEVLDLVEGNSLTLGKDNKKEVVALLKKAGVAVDVEPSGKLTATIKGKKQTLFFDDEITVNGKSVEIKKPSYVTGKL